MTIHNRDSMQFFLCVLGMVMVVEGLPYFAFPEKMKMLIQKVLEMPDSTVRKFGFMLMLMGIGLVYIGFVFCIFYFGTTPNTKHK